jgi:hypothetical protein
MLNLSRRSFLVGSLAVVSAASIPFAIPLVQDIKRFLRKDYWSIAVGGIGPQPEGMREISIYRDKAELPLMHWQMHNQAVFNCHPRDPIVNQFLRIDVIGGGNSTVDLAYIGTGVDGFERKYLERHEFPNRGPSKIIPLEL